MSKPPSAYQWLTDKLIKWDEMTVFNAAVRLAMQATDEDIKAVFADEMFLDGYKKEKAA